MTVHSASIKKSDNTITKRYKKKDEKAFVKFVKELTVYQVATKKKLKYIPKLISYDFKKRTITIEKIDGYDLGTIPDDAKTDKASCEDAGESWSGQPTQMLSINGEEAIEVEGTACSTMNARTGVFAMMFDKIDGEFYKNG